MASLASPSSPTSLQLTFCLRCRGPPTVSTGIRFLDHRIRLITIAGAQSPRGGQVGSWNGGDATPDSLAGWSVPERGAHGGDSQKKGGFGGIMGAGLSGLVFAAGVTFASMSLLRRTTSGVKQQLEPLTSEQEASLVPVDQVADEPSEVLADKESEIDCDLGIETALQVRPGYSLGPAVVDQVQGQALAALQVLKVIEADVKQGELCTRREYARWLVAASNALSRNSVSKVYPAMYIDNVTQFAFDDITPEDPDFSYIQGLAEAGIISSKLSITDLNGSFLFSPESPLSRQDLVSWKMALEKRLLPQVNRDDLYKFSGYIDIDRINPDLWPALAADLSAGEQGITVLAFGYTRLFQPNKPVTKAQAAIALSTGHAAEVVGEELARIEAESLAESAVNAHTALVAEVEEDLNASFAEELANEREKADAIEKLAEEARLELERLRAEKEEEDRSIVRGRVAVESEMEMLSKLRLEVEEQLQELMINKMEVSFERDKINKLRQGAESENQTIVQLQYELEVERKALSMARAWAEEAAKRAREQARALEEARNRWERHGIRVIVDADLQDDASTGITWLRAGEQPPVVETISRAERLVEKLRAMADEIKAKASNVIEKIIQMIVSFISASKQWAFEASEHANSKVSRSMEEFRENASEFGSSVGDKARTVVDGYKGSIDRIIRRFKP